jgi:hypothetical protein
MSFNVDAMTYGETKGTEMKYKANRNKPNDYRNWSPAALDAAIMYQVQYGRDVQHLDHLLAARNYKEQAA